jgi:hypothetical protein
VTSLWRIIPGFLILAPVALLLCLGVLIALPSGVHDGRSGIDYTKLAGNLSQMILRIAGYVVLLLAVQQLVGLRPSLGW